MRVRNFRRIQTSIEPGGNLALGYIVVWLTWTIMLDNNDRHRNDISCGVVWTYIWTAEFSYPSKLRGIAYLHEM